ncbi:isoprenylcysteine carboxylmethyltransferase family protein [Nocardiopsis sp. EMB25]|uniref:methyltransferase family protein n=1 Tax=Nocardiopsis TaxID=2013 RepID=UPI00034C1986|nr:MULTISPECIES: isoprenylcysteine carboxylmethyltransferase family protein [Nocardiopsis]MCY9783446.1 isoprenylcysteine carboxylmethyltransferase family protein [Nocardiopsis sp. EMB25]
MNAIALVLYLTGLVLVFGVRTLQSWRATGDTRFRRPDTTAFSAPWWGTVLFAVACLLGAAAPVTAIATEAFAPSPPVAWSGIGAMASGLLLVLAAQRGMGDSWRVGVQEDEDTELVTGGLFALVRNPVFTGMAVLLVGMAVALPGPLSAAALVTLVVAVQVQVRLIEEPYLLSTHGAAYRSYAARTGRFLPGLGRLAPADGQGERP